MLRKKSIVIVKKFDFEIFTYLYVFRSPEFIYAIFTVIWEMCVQINSLDICLQCFSLFLHEKFVFFIIKLFLIIILNVIIQYKYKNNYAKSRETFSDRFSRHLCFLFSFFLHGPTCGGVVTLKTGRREVPGSNPGRACQPNFSEFSEVFSETRVNTG